MKVVTTAQMRELEAAAVAAGATWPELMEQAGHGVALLCLRLVGGGKGRRMLALVGPGNNGGDALVAARLLHDAGAQVTLYYWRRPDTPDDHNRQLCRQRNIAEYDAADDSDRAELRRLVDSSALLIDGLLGMGISRPVVGELATIVDVVNERSPNTLLLSIDLPTGIDSDSGMPLGQAIRADFTAATGLHKRGLLQYPGRSYAGTIGLAPIKLVKEDVEALMSETIDATKLRELLPARPDDSHKGTFGKALVVAGSLLYPGAASLATAAAARVGAGIVTLASGRSTLFGPGRIPEITLRPLPEADWGALGEAAADELLKHLGNYQALLVGPGLGAEEATRGFIERLLGVDQARHRGQIGFRFGSEERPNASHARPELPPTVLDADALNHLSALEHWWERLPRGRCVLTPHVGEMRRLLGVEELDADHVAVAEQAAQTWGQVVVLKGATTVIADAEGHSLLHVGGNAALATAGTGDVLAGTIVGLLAQGVAPRDAAALGVYLHSAAGKLVRANLGDAGALASDLLPQLPLAIKALKTGASH